MNVHDVVDFLKDVIENKIELEPDEQQKLLKSCSMFLASQNENYRKKLLKKTKREKSLEDKQKIENCKLLRNKG